ncbi:MAG: hypothetical protein R3C19_21985 [Planctomycetaceae bacterium]
MPYHLLLPLFSSVVFVLGMMLAKRGIAQGASPWTATFFGNVWLAAMWIAVAGFRQAIVPMEFWGQAAGVGLLFLLGQVFTYLAFQLGDVSVATPVLGSKVLIVAALTAALTGQPVRPQVWLAAALAAVGIAMIQQSDRSQRADHRWLTIGLALLAALSLSLFDICLQVWGPSWTSTEFLPVAFGFTALFSCVLLSKVDSVKCLREQKAAGLILTGTLLMAVQAMSMSFALGTFGDAIRVNIVYALRGLWGVLLAWLLARWTLGGERQLGTRVMLTRLLAAGLLTAAVIIAIGI